TTTNASTDGNDAIAGTSWYAEQISGGLGNDTLTAVGDSDVLDGGEGSDTLIAGGNYATLAGGAGDDVLRTSSPGNIKYTSFNGGAGNDTLTGSYFADTYIFNRGDGTDVISDNGLHSTSSTYSDKLIFGEGIADEDVWLSRSGNDLRVQLLGDGGQVEIKNWYASTSYRIEELRLSDGQKLLSSQVDALVSAMAAFAPPAPGQSTLTPEQQSALSPVIAASWN
ncbi:MAG: calcium-binding protein, partial [Hydrogenophaga sp.]|nr:calcium-binding protein [Hydrogenophaga sp.]